MAKYRKKPVVIEAITFNELVEHGKNVAPESIDETSGMPWSFEYKGHSITHENDECYLVPTHQGIVEFRKEDMLITQIDGEIYPCNKQTFEATYEFVTR